MEAKAAHHYLTILPFKHNTGQPPLLPDTTAFSISYEVLVSYFGNVEKVGENWQSLEFKIQTSMANPSFLGRQKYSDLQSVLKDFQMAIINGDKWDKPNRPLWLLQNSHLADNPAEIKEDYIKRAAVELEIDLEEDLFSVEWQEC